MTIDEEHLKSWIGNSVAREDTIDLKQVRLIEASLDKEALLNQGNTLPPLWHWCFHLEGLRISQAGRDGHATKGEFLPPVPLPRRMWAGGRLTFTGGLKIGETYTKTSTIQNVTTKEGRSGSLCFVTVCHDYRDKNGAVKLAEEHDIVYREDPEPGAPAPAPVIPPSDAATSRTIGPSTALLFRYSALTFNPHRIHYGRDYCRDVEGYPGLVFHGPLTATLLADFACANANINQLKSFNFRATAPLFDTDDFKLKSAHPVNGTTTLWAETPQGHLAMGAEAVFE